MLDGKRVAVVVPAHDEEKLIAETIGSMPGFVDRIIVVDDFSRDPAWEVIPRYRYLGNAFLSLLTKIASGYWHVADSQSGYTAVSLQMLELLDLDRIYPRYGFPNDMLVHLNVMNARVRDYPSRPIYG